MMTRFPAKVNKQAIQNNNTLYPKGSRVIQTLQSNSTNKGSTEPSVGGATHAFNLLEHEIKNPLAAIQINQELLLEQLALLDEAEAQGHIMQTAGYKGQHKLCQILAIAMNIAQYSLQSLSHIAKVFKQVRQKTSFLTETPLSQPVESCSVGQAFDLLEYKLKDPLVAIDNNQALLQEQLILLAAEALEGRLITTANYQGLPLNQCLRATAAICDQSLNGLRHITQVFTNVRQLTGLVSQPIVGKTTAQPTQQTIQLKKLVFEALEQCHNQYPHIQTKIDCTLTDKISLKGNASLLKQAFLNMIQNGYEALASYQGKHPCLTLRLYEVLKPVKAVGIEIHTNGPIIPPELITTIFEPYVSTKSTPTTDATENKGLGLAVAKQAIEAHQGTVVCQSKEGEGTTFFVLLRR
jgi:signal transduction histidine kinase